MRVMEELNNIQFPRIDDYFYPSGSLAEGWKFKSQKARAAWILFRLYLNGTITQWNRMAENADSSRKDMGNLQVWCRNQIDLHFYLICWDKMHKYLKVFVNEQDDSEILRIYSRIKRLLEMGKLARDHLEHLDKRIDRPTTGFHYLGIGSDGMLTLAYRDVPNKGGIIERDVALGKDEVEQVMATFKNIMDVLEGSTRSNPRQNDL
jgi:hypothetical protein